MGSWRCRDHLDGFGRREAELAADELEDEKKRAAANAEASIEKLEDVGAWILGDAGAEPDGL